MPPRTYEGEVVVCFHHFVAKYPTGWLTVRNLIAESCSVSTDTVLRWREGETRGGIHKPSAPTGEVKFRLAVFLTAAGYRISELTQLPKNYRSLAEILGLQVLTLKNVKVRLGYQNEQDVHRLLRGETVRLPSDKLIALDGMIKEMAAEVQKRRATLIATIEQKLDLDLSSTSGPVTTYQTASAEPIIVGTPHEPAVIDSLVTSLSTLLGPSDHPLAMFEPMSTERRRAIRDLVGTERLQELIERLEALF
ncbi:MAG: hypothetical protein JWS12_606 [Candidatus Saccharibacteria bacterium]|nr:hypothetical protein [Candidatus Saccharibacteria bacterium]